MTGPDSLQLGSLTVDLAHAVVTDDDGVVVRLTPSEQSALRILAQAKGQAVSRSDLCASGGRAADALVRRLRRKLEPDPSQPRYLQSKHGEGYLLVEAPTGREVLRLAGGIRLDVAGRLVRRPEGLIGLTDREVELLGLLLKSRGLVTRERLLTEVLGYRVAPKATRALDRAMQRLRAKIETGPGVAQHLLTIPGLGYLFELRTPSTNLGPPLSRLVGRAPELQALRVALGEARLVNLLGPGGIGKSRLAQEVVRTTHETWHGGAWVCELGSVTTIEGLSSAISHALSFQGPTEAPSGDLPPALLDFLTALGSTLLVFDGCEVAASPLGAVLPSLLSHTPDLHILCTSRIRLEVRAEHVVRLGPLPALEAKALFIARLEDHRVVDDEPEAISRLVDHLHGMPLALEIAAGAAAIRTATELATQIDVMTLSDRRADKARCMADAFSWSWETTPPADQAVLARVGVFAGGFTSALALRIVGDTPDIMGALHRLTDTSWLTWARGVFTLHPLARDFVWSQAHADTPAAVQRHTQTFSVPQVHRDPALWGEFSVALERNGDDPETMSRVWLSFWNGLIQPNGPYQWAAKRTRALLALPVSQAQRGWLMHAMGYALDRCGDLQAALEIREAALDVATAENDAQLQARVLGHLAEHASDVGDTSRAARLAEQCQRAFGLLGPLDQAAGHEVHAAWCYRQDDFSGAIAALSGTLKLLANEDDMELRRASIHCNLAILGRLQGDVEGARNHLRSAQELAPQASGRIWAHATLQRSILHLEAGHLDVAWADASAAADAIEATGDVETSAFGHAVLASISEARGDRTTAQRHRKRMGQLVAQLDPRVQARARIDMERATTPVAKHA